MKLQEKRRECGIEQLDLAKRIGTTAPMMSCFENYKCLPIPTMLEAICKELNCERRDIYSDDELYLPEKKPVAKQTHTRKEPNIYKLTVRLPERARKVLSPENLEKCGYHSLKDFIWHSFIAFEKQLALQENKKATMHPNCKVANDESGIIPTQRTISIDHFSIKINK